MRQVFRRLCRKCRLKPIPAKQTACPAVAKSRPAFRISRTK
ncbi:hypothetical protein NEIPOLOT_02599 [Neisseria polysaccharea ATCC 43768]|nr:hypothetical protein NEIPOLOT_02599 [Neisseria polysaccharea ATCC 43768]